MKLWGLEWSALDSYFQFVEQSASPSTPESGHIRLYSKDSGTSISTLCYKNDAGSEVCFPTGAGTLVTGLGVAGRVAFWDSVSNLTSDADLTFAVDTLSATKLASSVLTATQLVYAGAAGLLTSISELTFVPTAANSSIITLGDDNHTGVINTPAGLTINIDSNNNDTGALLAIQVNTALRLTGGTRLFTINESGALGLGNAVDFGVSGQALITQGNAASPTWVTLVTDHGALTGLSDDDHTQYALLAGRAGGQTLIGGTGASDPLVLRSTSNATKGVITLADQGGHVVVGGGGTASELRLLEPSGSGTNYVSFSSPALAANVNYTLPIDDGDAAEVLTTDGNGVLSWEPGGSGGGLTHPQVLARVSMRG